MPPGKRNPNPKPPQKSPLQFWCGFQPPSKKQRGKFRNSNNMRPAKAMTSLRFARKPFLAARMTTNATGFAALKTLARAGKIKKVLVHEISRIARRNSIAQRFVKTLEECGVSRSDSKIWSRHALSKEKTAPRKAGGAKPERRSFRVMPNLAPLCQSLMRSVKARYGAVASAQTFQKISLDFGLDAFGRNG
jgi:hypothetical protein